MSSYLSSVITNTTSRYESLRRTLLSDEGDGDTEDDSHVTRVLRAHYTEKGRPFPSWLPPDPKAPQPPPAQFISSAGRPSQIPSGGRSGGLSDLWDSSQSSTSQESLSLRRAGRGPGLDAASSGPRPRLGGRVGIVDSYESSRGSSPAAVPTSLPSQRAGSYQSSLRQQGSRAQDSTSPPPSTSSVASSAQERLKARLLGGKQSPSASPLPSPGISPGINSSSQRNPYDRAGSYDDRSSETGSSRRGREQPFTGSNAPWSSGSGGGYGSGGYSGGYGDNDGSGYGRQGTPGGGARYPPSGGGRTR